MHSHLKEKYTSKSIVIAASNGHHETFKWLLRMNQYSLLRTGKADSVTLKMRFGSAKRSAVRLIAR